jgi:DNA-binding IclR family transcriptional regulator
MPAKRDFDANDFLELLRTTPLSTGDIARKIRCHPSTALRYLRELKATKLVEETRISNTSNIWRLIELSLS